MAEYQQTGPFSRQSAANVERVPGQIWGMLQSVGRKLGQTGKYLSSQKAATDYAKLVSGQLPNFGRSAIADERYGPPAPEYYGPGYGPSKIVTGTTDGVTPDRSQSDMYRQYAPKPFPMTPEGQFERYFKTPEMDQYFGATSRGQGAPKDVAGMESLAGQLTAPQDVPLSAYYRAQSAAGRANMPKITQELEYAEGSPLAKWAAANPMLAQRLYAKKQAGGAAGLAPDEQTVMGDLGSRAQSEAGYTPQAFNQQRSDTESFSVAANAVPAPWNTQGEKVSGEFAGVVPFQAAKTTGEGMPQFQTTGEKTAEFLKRPGISALF